MIANIATAPPHRRLRVVLVLIAALEFLDALRRAKYFYRLSHPTAFLRFAQTLISILVLAPVIAGAAPHWAPREQNLPPKLRTNWHLNTSSRQNRKLESPHSQALFGFYAF